MKRFFSDDSFWNTPIGADCRVDQDGDRLISLLADKEDRGFWLNIKQWTIPVYRVDAATPRRTVGPRFPGKTGHGPGFGKDVPIPDDALPDPQGDAHLAVVDWQDNLAWDMWGAARDLDGEWQSGTGMVYPLDGTGVFDRNAFPVKDGESIHKYGPSRASGVPAIAGLIMHHEVAAGRIRHKLVFGSKRNAFKKFIYPPACWTDGHLDDGLPEGCIVQLDPELDLDRFGLAPGACAVARALQDYGAVNVDNAGGSGLYGEGLYGHPARTWEGLLGETDLLQIGMGHFRVLAIENVIEMGDVAIRNSGWGKD
ncbi:MAG: hypothetical protein HQ592_14935 [Planctomycetes bacterium]|nr:hypothetical protein [Planctomycetota bacterium]